MESSYFGPQRRLRHILTKGGDSRSEFINHMRVAARRVILRHAKDVVLSRINEKLPEGQTNGLRAALRQCVQAATPKLLKTAGGGRRLLLVTPGGVEASHLQEEVQLACGDNASVVSDGGNQVLLCYDVEQLSLEAVTGRFLKSLPDCQELAARLHTRTDVNW
jgi:hypothetical protein